MAGFYPDVPSQRFSWDDDGTVVFTLRRSGSTIVDWSQGEKENSNGEVGSHSMPGKATGGIWVNLLFPESRTIYGWVQSTSYGANWSVGNFQTSVDTTNGLDGNWVDHGSTGNAGNNKNAMRESIQTPGSMPVTGIKAVRLGYNNSSSAGSMSNRYIHIFGEYDASDRLAAWDPTLDQALGGAALDWGDVARGDPAVTRTFRIKNRASTLTAKDVSVTLEALTDTTPSVPGWHDLSTDGVTFSSSISIGDLSAGSTSGTLHVRRAPPTDATLGLWWARLQAQATTWI